VRLDEHRQEADLLGSRFDPVQEHGFAYPAQTYQDRALDRPSFSHSLQNNLSVFDDSGATR
jgi:hypothetical protein